MVKKIISKTLSGAVKKKGTGIVARKIVEPIAEESAEETLEKAPVVASKKPSAASKAIEPSPTPEEPVGGLEFGSNLPEEEKAFFKQQSIAEQTEEALPALNAEEALPALNAEEALPTPKAETSKFDFPNKVFTDEQYQAALDWLGENTRITINGQLIKSPQGWENTKLTAPKTYANKIQEQAAKMFGKEGEDVPAPYPSAQKKTMDEILQEAEEAKRQKAIDDQELSVYEKPEVNIGSISQYFKGKLGSGRGFQPKRNNEIMEEIRKERESTFSDLISLSQTDKYDDPVLSVAQGEFRFKHGHELDLSKKSDRVKLFKLLDAKQSEYNRLKKKYADTPDIMIYHGGEREKIESIKREGFRRPSLSKRGAQQELVSGATSLTRDVVLTFKDFGRDPEYILGKRVPYAEYVFSRVNMTPEEYSNKSLDAIARTITGDPTSVRSLQLPRGGFNETESAMIESDKFNVKPIKDEVRGMFGQYQEIDLMRKAIAGKGKIESVFNRLEKEFITGYNTADGAVRMPKQMTQADASKTYSAVKMYLDNISQLGRMSNVRSGMGQQYQEMVEMDLPRRVGLLQELKNNLSAYGMNQKAKNISDLINTVERFSGSKDNKIQDALLKLVDKFEKGGLVRRK